MAGILFDEIVFGPVKSRRFGVSLGINLLPLHGKLCSFNCIYCECGLTNESKKEKLVLFSASEINASLQSRFEALKSGGLDPDNITFAGNGEPTLHPDFETIIDNTIRLRDEFFPKAMITVLSNATRLDRPTVKRALLRIDNNVLKLDAGTNSTFQAINRPTFPIALESIIQELKNFEGNLVIQTMLIRGEVDGKQVDNTTEAELTLWLKHIREINPKLVMLYPIDRQTPYQTLEKVPAAEFQALAERIETLGIKAEVFY
ncbi:MAG: radical SAM protein [Lentimicrobiaceae bacterium]|jgi:wyosine [tRNA(Phe)-imidazoG37] synthetase (radical SAM superfamily)